MMLLKLFKELSLHPKNAAELKGLITNLAINGKLTQAKKPEVKSLGEIIQFTKNGFTGRPNDEKYGIKRLGIETVTQSAFLEVNEGLAKYIEIDEKKKENYFAKDKDVFICRQNGNLRFVGKAAVYYGEDDKLIFSDSLIQVRPNSVLIDSSFLVVFINSEKARHQIDKFCATTAGNFSINGTNLKKIIIPLYSIKEQHAIVTIVNQLFAEVEQLEQLTKERIQLKHDFAASALQRLVQAGNINGEWAAVQQHFHTFFNEKPNVKKLRETSLQLAVQGKLTTHWRKENPNTEPATELLKRIAAEKQQLIKSGKIKKEKPQPPIKENEIPYELPEGWVWSNLESICTKITDGFHHTPKKQAEGFRYISATHIKEKGIAWNDCLFIGEKEHSELFRKAKPTFGDILIVNRGAGCGTPAIVDVEEPFSFQNAALIGFNQEMVIPNYIYLFILKIRSEIMEFFTNGGAQPMLSNKTLKTLLFSLPPVEEQHAIVTTVNTLMGLCDRLEQEIEQQQKQVEELMRSCVREVVE